MNDVTEMKLSMPLRDMQNVFGGNDNYMKKIEDNLHVEIIDRNGELHIIGGREEVARASAVIHQLSKLSSRGSEIEEQSVNYAISLKKEQQEEEEDQNNNVLLEIDKDCICHTINGKPVKPKTLGQKKYVDDIRNHMITFGLGPAGTGKTYLGMAMAITAFQKEEVSRIILTRPAIEAGEKLGFLPGDLQSKVDPYLRPLYDALYQIM